MLHSLHYTLMVCTEEAERSASAAARSAVRCMLLLGAVDLLRCSTFQLQHREHGLFNLRPGD
jgi:hypothetical protein